MPETIQQQLERLRRLVGLLPRTAENLPVVFHGGGFHVAQPTPAFAAKVPGAFVTTLWHPDFNKPAEGWGYDHELGGYYLSWSFCRPNREVAAVERRPVHECYISREAAKAAADRHTGGEDA